MSSLDSKWIATTSCDCTIILWNSDGQVLDEWIAHDDEVYSLAFSPDARYLASSGRGGEIIVWDVSRGAPSRGVATLNGHATLALGCAWSADGSMIASCSRDNLFRVWDATTFQQLHVFKRGKLPPTVPIICFSLDGRWLSSAYSAGPCRVWDVASPTLSKVLRGAMWPLSAGSVGVWGIRIVTVSESGIHEMWDGETGKRLSEPDAYGGIVSDASFSPDGSLVLSALSDHTVQIWNATTGDIIFSLEGHTDSVTRACFSPCGRYVASASDDKTVRLWSTSDGSCIAALGQPRKEVWRMAFSPNGKTLSSGARDGTVLIRQMTDLIPAEDSNS